MHRTHRALKHKRSLKNPQIHTALFVLPYLAYRIQTFLLSWTFPADCGWVVGSPNTSDFHLTCRIISLSNISVLLHINDCLSSFFELFYFVFLSFVFINLWKSLNVLFFSLIFFSLSIIFSKPTFLFLFFINQFILLTSCFKCLFPIFFHLVYSHLDFFCH